jgi:hypothetical protein
LEGVGVAHCRFGGSLGPFALTVSLTKDAAFSPVPAPTYALSILAKNQRQIRRNLRILKKAKKITKNSIENQVLFY